MPLNKGYIKQLIKEVQSVDRKIGALCVEKSVLEGMIKGQLGENYERTNIYCADAPDSHHIYGPGLARGAGYRRCIWCNNDDFDGF